MDKQQILNWLNQVARGELAPDEVLNKLDGFPYQDLDFAKVDLHRALRSGAAEVIYCPNKTSEQIVKIFAVLAGRAANVMATRASRRIYQQVRTEVPEAEYFEAARMVAVWREHQTTAGRIGIVSAGTADMRIAEEAALTAEILGSSVNRIYDVGVAGIHRLLDQREVLEACRVLVVVAGMEGALASVVGGLVGKPIVAVPTSVGYGANFQGLAPLLAMLNSCAGGIGVVNIDNGYGAGVLAHRINLLGEGLG